MRHGSARETTRGKPRRMGRLLVVGLFSKGQRSPFISGTGRTTRRYGREGLGTRREKTDYGLFCNF